ncbi:Hypothetical protein Minf_0768 [Methylacidiphilum infernorum V4]|uniref:Uncharacterized protein n=1 Tax=Methylacidiphilum infernorum (isolate V4) TaxID=481448 RepID=B3E0R9_METI4|nr:Hypothetical protein Minf_0768 [Methylacidiphilum infernorum V4]
MAIFKKCRIIPGTVSNFFTFSMEISLRFLPRGEGDLPVEGEFIIILNTYGLAQVL